MYGVFTASIRPRAFWPDRAEPKVKITDRGPSGVLMVQNLRDPATPLSGALRTRRALGERARMVTIDQGGHVAYLSGSNACGNNAVNDCLVTGKRPAHGPVLPRAAGRPVSRSQDLPRSAHGRGPASREPRQPRVRDDRDRRKDPPRNRLRGHAPGRSRRLGGAGRP
ncbi:alpha/beta hydrolase [Streptomyces sp. NPDC059922]|uniref:alpha/beta hydrolase n=1 Tax=Streptomyces sp. NPDC059922 TaxID=3347005 RepID=UPI00364767FA